MDLPEIIEALDEHDPSKVKEALQQNAQPYYQAIYDDGHQAGLGEINAKHERTQKQLEEAQNRAESLEGELNELREEQPDLQELRSTWEEDELQPVLEERDKWKEKAVGGKKETAQQKVQSQLASKVKHDWVAQNAVKDASDRIKVSEDGDVQYLRPDGQTPYAAADGQDPSELFANDVLGSVPDVLQADNTQGGERSIDGEGSGGGGQNGSLKRSEMSDKQVSQYIRQHGIEEYQKLPK